MRKLPWAIPLFVVLPFCTGAIAQTVKEQLQPDERRFLNSLRSSRRNPTPPHRLASGSPAGNPAAQVGGNVQVNDPQAFFPDGLIGRSEPTVAASESGTQLLAGWIDVQGACGIFVDCTPPPSPGLIGFAFSTDAGRTWTDGGSPPVLDHAFTFLDPWADRGGRDRKTFYLSSTSRDDIDFLPLGIGISRGHFGDKGFHWDDHHLLSPTHEGDGFDRDVIVMAKDGSGAGYLSLSNFIGECGQPIFGWGQIEVFRTRDGGDTWQGPVVVSPDVTFITDPNDPNCGLTGINQQGAQPVIGPNGEVYIAWRFGPRVDLDSYANKVRINVARSVNGGVTFDPPVVITEKNLIFDQPPVGFGGDQLPDHPRIAVATSGPHKGRVYVVFAEGVAPVSAAPLFPCPDPYAGETCQEQNLTSIQVYLKFSDDQAMTWSDPIRVGPPVPSAGVKRFWPVVSVEPSGNVNVAYYESQEKPVASNPVCAAFLTNGNIRYGAANSLVDTFIAQSTDGGRTFSSPSRISTVTSNWCTTYSDILKNFGDYIDSVSVGDRVLTVWTDGRNGVPDVFFSRSQPKPE